jgi:type II secretory pathway pseudopilin PulG
MRSRSPQGFTIVEAMLAVGIIAILVALAMPSIQTGNRTTLMRSATQEVMHLMDLARVQAQSRNRAYEVAVNLGAGLITLNESANTKCSGIASGLSNVRQLVLGVGNGDFGEVGIVKVLPDGLGSQFNLCFKPDGRVLRTDTEKPIPSSDAVYGAGEARIVLQRKQKGIFVEVRHTIVVPYNGIPVFEAGG